MAGFTRYVQRNSPRQEQIAEHVRQLIVSGKLAPGQQVPSLNQLVEKFNTSNMTVQRAFVHLREAGYITTERWRGSFVAGNPPHLSHVGVVYDRPQDGSEKSNFHNALRAEIERVQGSKVSEGDFKWRFSHYYGSQGFVTARDRRNLLNAVEHHLLAGLIFMGTPKTLMDTPAVTQETLPKISIGETSGMIDVSPNHWGIFERALDYLRSRGRKRVAFLVYGDSDASVASHCSRLQELAASRDMITYPYWIHGTRLELTGWVVNATQLLMHTSREERPDAMIIADDNFVPNVTAALRDAGVNVPGELEVIAETNFPHPTTAAVPVVRLGFDVKRMLDTSLDLIRRKNSGQDVPEMTVIEPVFEHEL